MTSSSCRSARVLPRCRNVDVVQSSVLRDFVAAEKGGRMVLTSRSLSPDSRTEPARSMAKTSDSEEHRCQWLDCTILFSDAESLYDHITSTHIGRKSAGTLSLECKWTGCNAKASKRDHLTSHARVHINLKPHSCEVCGKSFKRPQDLKKHEKIHTEEHHAHHKHSKAVTVGASNSGAATTASSITPAPGGAVEKQSIAQQQPLPSAYAPFPYPGYPFFGQPMYAGNPAALSQMDVNQILEHQRQLNAHVLNSAAYGLPTHFPLPSYPAPGTFPGTAALTSMPMFAAGLPAPYAFPYYQHPSLQLPPNVASSLMPSNPALQAGSAPPQPSLYPSLPQLGTATNAHLLPTASKQQDNVASAPASPYSTQSANSGQSPKVPSLSPASVAQSYSPSPERDTDPSLFKRAATNNAVAGQKRAFEDAAGEFLSDIKNKRFQEDDLGAHVNSIDALALLLTPNDFGPSPVSPITSQGRSSTSSATASSDYNRTDVEHINDILANLAQNLDDFDQKPMAQYTQPQLTPQPQHLHHHAPAPAPTTLHNVNQNHGAGSMYPSLGGYEPRPLAALPSRIYQDANASNGLASIRLAKSPGAPTLAANDNRIPQYHHMERLTRAPPSSSFREYRLRLESMDVDEEDGKLSRGYSASLRSTSLDSTTSEDRASSSATSVSSAASKPALIQGPTLSPILDTPVTTKSLPHLRDMLADPMRDSSLKSLYPTVASLPLSSSSSSTSSSRPSSSGGMERLVPSFTKMEMPSDEEDEEDDDDEEAQETEESIRKKSRFESPTSMEEDEDDEDDDASGDSNQTRRLTSQESSAQDRKMRRMQVLKALIVYINETYRRQLAVKVLAGGQAE